MNKALGCGQRIALGYYQFPEGASDVLNIMTNPGTSGIGANACHHTEQFITIFGSNQNYDDLINTEAGVVAQKVKNSVSRSQSKNIIIEWKKLYSSKVKDVVSWLKKLIS